MSSLQWEVSTHTHPPIGHLVRQGQVVLSQVVVVTLDKEVNRVSHEFCCHLKDIIRQGGAEKHILHRGREVTIDTINLIFETLVEELIGLVQDKHLDVTHAEGAPPNRIKHPTRRPGDSVLAIFKFTYIFTN